MKKLTIIVLLCIALFSCEKNEIVIQEKTLFVYDAISNYRNEIDYKFLENDYTQKHGTLFFNYETGVIVNTYYGGLNLTEKVVYIINEIHYDVFISELNSNLTIEIFDSIWIEPIMHKDIFEKTEHSDSNIWVLKKGIGMYDDKYLLINERK